MKYDILVSFNANKLFSSIGSIVDEINNHMNRFGFSEQISLRSERVPMAILTSDRELLLEERNKIADIYAKTFEEKFPGSNPEVEIISNGE